MGGGAKDRGWRLGFADGGCGCGALLLELVLEGGADEGREERMRLERLGLEFRMELAAEKPRVIRRFDDFDVIFVGSAAGDAEASSDEGLFVFAIEFVAVAVAFADFSFAVGFVGKGAGFELAGPRAEAHGAAHFVHAEQFAQFVNDAVRRLRIELGAVGLLQPGTSRAYSIVAHCMPRQIPKNGNLVLAGVLNGVDHSLNAALAEAAGNQDAVVAAQARRRRSPANRFLRLQSIR